MLEIHERMKSGIPVIIEGETGVGKTALLEMLSLLWNASLLEEHRQFLDVFCDEFKEINESECTYFILLFLLLKLTVKNPEYDDQIGYYLYIYIYI